jgi:hypothetical protein
MTCFTKAEMGEDKAGNNFHERIDAPPIKGMSKMDFDKLLITNADTGKKTKMQTVGDNLFVVKGTYYEWVYSANDSRTIVMESSINDKTIHTKILFCD